MTRAAPVRPAAATAISPETSLRGYRGLAGEVPWGLIRPPPGTENRLLGSVWPSLLHQGAHGAPSAGGPTAAFSRATRFEARFFSPRLVDHLLYSPDPLLSFLKRAQSRRWPIEAIVASSSDPEGMELSGGQAKPPQEEDQWPPLSETGAGM